MTTLILIRHGETDWNITGRYQGQADPPLNERGIDQSKKLAHSLLEGTDIDFLITSPLKRATQTAQEISALFNVPLFVEPRLMEIHQGDWQTRLRSEIVSLYPDLFHRWETEPWLVTPPGGEHLSAVQDRVYAAVDDIITNYPKQHVGLVTHRIPIALLLMRYRDLESDVVRTINLPNTYWEIIYP
jgi:broad specificity phosphatase PhoE